jgi:NitT/TauT family transport system ATP-binding protein
MKEERKTVVKFSGVHKKFGSLEVIKNLNFKVSEGEVVSLIGLSGCGKSTTLRIIAGLEEVDKGAVEKRFNNLGFIFQEPRLLPWRTVLDNICFVLKDRIPNKIKRQEIALHYLNLMKLIQFKDYYPAQLSGGMKSRVSVARALAIDPDIILMDEPFSDIDFPLRLVLIDSLKEILEKEPKTVIYVTHDIRDALLLSDRIYVLTARPMYLKEELFISEESRDINNPKFSELERYVIKLLKEELGIKRLDEISPESKVIK